MQVASLICANVRNEMELFNVNYNSYRRHVWYCIIMKVAALQIYMGSISIVVLLITKWSLPLYDYYTIAIATPTL